MKDFIEHYKEPLKWLIVLFFAPGLIQGNLPRWHKGGASTDAVALGTSFMRMVIDSYMIIIERFT